MISKATPKWVQAILTFKEVIKNFFAKLRGAGSPFFFPLPYSHMPAPGAATPVELQQAGHHNFLQEREEGKDSSQTVQSSGQHPPVMVHTINLHQPSIWPLPSLLFQHIQNSNSFFIWYVIVQYMDFPHIAEIIMLTNKLTQPPQVPAAQQAGQYVSILRACLKKLTA